MESWRWGSQVLLESIDWPDRVYLCKHSSSVCEGVSVCEREGGVCV